MEKRSRSDSSIRNTRPVSRPTSDNIRQVSSLYALVPVVREAHVAVNPSSWGGAYPCFGCSADGSSSGGGGSNGHLVTWMPLGCSYPPDSTGRDSDLVEL